MALRHHENSQPAASDFWKALGWASIALVAVVLAQVLALPPNRPVSYELGGRADFWRPEWLVATTFVCWPVFLCARRSWWLAVPVVLLVSAQLWFMVDSAVEVLNAAGLAGSLDGGWYAVGAFQVAICLVAAWRGAALNISHRRWVRAMVALLPGAAEPGRTDWEQGYSSAG